MNQQSSPSPLQLSALQLAWMQELGIDKPWIPESSVQARSAQIVSPQALPAVVAEVDRSPLKPVVPVAQGRKMSGNTSSTFKKTADVLVVPQMDTARMAAQATSLEELGASIAQCNACSLCKEREQVVLGQGVMQPALMVIGEGPGDQEDRQGLPFVGRSGMLLDNMLASIGSSRTSDVYVTNIIKCRPPGNRNPRPEEIAACRPYLMRQIELVRPFSILAMGRFAAHTLLGMDSPLAEMRERPFTLQHAGQSLPVVVTYHPAYLLRRPSDKAAAWKDLQRARLISKGS